jgi:acetoacetyl-CoA synthetase
MCVGQRRPHDQDESVVLFLKMHDGYRFSTRLRNRIRETIRDPRSPRQVPKYILEVKDIPYTFNGRKIELVIKQIISGKTPKVSATRTTRDSSTWRRRRRTRLGWPSCRLDLSEDERGVVLGLEL